MQGNMPSINKTENFRTSVQMSLDYTPNLAAADQVSGIS